jgi:hypothetical protein
MRFWVEALNLTWGDYVIFQSQVFVFLRKLARLAGENERSCMWLLLRIPTLSVWFLIFSLFAMGSWTVQHARGEGPACQSAQNLYMVGVGLWLWLFTASFFSFLSPCAAAAFSPLLRNIHQLVRYYYEGNEPPPMLYITDGGAVDCTTLTQLVLRKTKRIFMVLAAMDPNDELGVLRTAMAQCVDMKLCSFFDPKDPERDITVVLDAWKSDRSMPFMHIGIKYGWQAPGEGNGHLVIVKNRIRPECQPWPVQPLLTQDELAGRSHDEDELVVSDFEFDAEAYEEKDLTQDDLGGLGCCDCCHLCGCNQGGKWPQLTGANYLWLTPQLFNGLCRLGNNESDVPLDIITGPLPGI